MIKRRLSRGFNLTRDSQTQIGKSQQILVDGESARLEAAHLENGNILSASSALNALRPFSDRDWAQWIVKGAGPRFAVGEPWSGSRFRYQEAITLDASQRRENALAPENRLPEGAPGAVCRT